MRPGKKTRQRGGDNSYWTSYSDMMAGMLFVFALILFAAVYQLVDLQQKKTVELQTKEAQLSTQQSLLIDQEAELKDKEELLAATTLALQQQQQELDENRTALTSAQESLSLQQSKIEEQAALLAAQQAHIDKLVGLRSQIIEDLRDNLSNVGQRVTVDRKTGAVTFESSVLLTRAKMKSRTRAKRRSTPAFRCIFTRCSATNIGIMWVKSSLRDILIPRASTSTIWRCRSSARWPWRPTA